MTMKNGRKKAQKAQKAEDSNSSTLAPFCAFSRLFVS
jgi:hypothetical protein